MAPRPLWGVALDLCPVALAELDDGSSWLLGGGAIAQHDAGAITWQKTVPGTASALASARPDPVMVASVFEDESTCDLVDAVAVAVADDGNTLCAPCLTAVPFFRAHGRDSCFHCRG